ncbi:MAG: ParA family protein [Deltaproteobacteria bacterium]|nr:ParA family protein [Deltaproteobacteria bacterium]
MGRVLAVANQKGGVGKTTTAVNLSAGLALAGRSTLLIDFDPQASATSGLGVHPQGLEASIYHVLIGVRPAEEVIRETQIEHLSLLPSSRDLIGAEIELVPLPRREYRLDDAIAQARRQYEFVIIDCPPSLGLLTVNALTAADAVLIPLQCEYYALEGLSALLETVGFIRQSLNPKLDIQGLLLTMFDTRNGLAHQVVNEVRQHFPNQVFEAVVPRNVRLSESPSYGLPAMLYDASSRGAQAYAAVAQELIQNTVRRL